MKELQAYRIFRLFKELHAYLFNAEQFRYKLQQAVDSNHIALLGDIDKPLKCVVNTDASTALEVSTWLEHCVVTIDILVLFNKDRIVFLVVSDPKSIDYGEYNFGFHITINNGGLFPLIIKATHGSRIQVFNNYSTVCSIDNIKHISSSSFQLAWKKEYYISCRSRIQELNSLIDVIEALDPDNIKIKDISPSLSLYRIKPLSS